MLSMCVRYVALLFFLSTLVWGVQVHAATIDSQTDDSAQATRPPTESSYLRLGRFYLAVGYLPSRNFSLAGVRFRVNTSGGGNYVCPRGDIIRYHNTSRPVLWSSGVLVGTIVPIATTTPDAYGNCDYTARDRYGKPIPVSKLNYYVFFMSVGDSTTKWVSMSGKSYVEPASPHFGYRDAFMDSYVWGASGLEKPYFEMFDTAPPPVIPPDPCAVPGTCASNVLFLPGIEASRLYEDLPCASGVCETKLWEPGGDTNAARLAHDASGASVDTGIYTKKNDIIDNAYIPLKGNVYKSFIEQMNALVATSTINAWEAIPYDWRLTPDQILDKGAEVAPGKISYLVATSSPYIIQELKRLAATSKTKKVTIIAHSNGGLVTKRLIEKLGVDAATLVDKVIFVAVPQAGTPQAIGALLHGYDQGLPASFMSYGLSDGMARTLAKNMPMTYNLLPSKTYFTQVDDAVATFTNEPLLAPFRARYGDLIHSQDRLHTFIADSWRLASSTTEGLNYPSVGNESLLTNAETLHTSLDAWAPPTGIPLYEIAGWGEKTLAGIDYYQGVAMHCDQFSGKLSRCTSSPKVEYRPRIVLDGDGTVVTPSALWTTGAKRYWVDLKTYNGFFGITKHASILEVPQLRTFIKNLLTNNDNASLPQYVSTSTPVNLHPNPNTELHFTLHSPLTLNLYDDQGRHTGISTTTGELEEDIPESRYMRFGEVQFISVPTSLNTRLVMNGYAEGSFTLDAEEVQGEVVVASTTFAGIPSTSSAIAVMDIPSGGLANAGPLTIDENGDGKIDITLAPKPGATVTLDITPPVTSFSATGAVGLHEWYTSNVTATLTATDTESTIASTTHSFDNGATWNTYSAPFIITKEGSTTILYHSIDTAGNIESIASTTIKIDKTAPEATLSFSTTTKMLAVTGVDALSPVNVSASTTFPEFKLKKKKENREQKGIATTTATLTDDAGNTTVLTYTQKPSDSKQRETATIASVSYNGIVFSFIPTKLQYKWKINKKGKYTMFVAYLKTASSTVEAHYRPKKNVTVIMTKPVELDDRDEDDDAETRPARTKLPGLVIPGLQTEKGSVKVIY